jgi:peroxiredoxin Q/BCP
MSRFIYATLAASLLLVSSASLLAAQDAGAEGPDFLAVGEMAPDVALTGATRWGILDQPVSLEQFRGQTVVLAFFPAARTRGCTIQMQTYREEYQRVFNGGRDVVLIAISNDSAADLASWAADEDFPFLFASDPNGEMYRAFGGIPNPESGRFGRTLVVLDGEGRVAELLPRFMEVDPTSYDALQATVAELAAR